MQRLSDKEFWNQVYVNHAAAPAEEAPLTWKKKLTGFIKSKLGSSIQPYSSYLLWENIFSRHLKAELGQTMLEVGSAPGERLLQFRDTFGYEPYGVEYAEEGVAQNKALFLAKGANPDHVIHSDFFSEEFQTKYANQFDFVYSGGFIEHFDNAKEVARQHLALVKPGGRLAITIPRLTGINYPIASFLNRDNITIHNLNIMNLEPFRALFEHEGLEPLYCGYLGTFSLNIVEPKHWHGFKYRLIRLGWIAQLGLNVMFRAVFGNKGPESRWFSPYLVFVGVKKDA